MRVKRSLAASAVLGILAVVAGCNTAGDGGSGGSAQSKTISVFVAAHKEGFETAAKSFEKANPGATVKFSYAPTDSYVTTMRTRLSSGSAPDVFYVYPGAANAMAMYNLTAQDYLADLSGAPWVSRVPDSIAPITQDDGKTFILPMTFDAIGALYNQAAFEKVGGSAPETWTELLSFCEKARAKGMVAFALGNQTKTDTQFLQYGLVGGAVYADHPRFAEKMAKGQATFAGSGWETAFEKQLAMRDHGCFNNRPNGTSYDKALSMVATGEAVAFVGVTPQLGALKLKNEDAEFGMFPVPATDDPEGLRLPAAPGVGVGVNAQSENLALAKKFVDFLAQPKTNNAFIEGRGSLPAIPNEEFQVPSSLQAVVEYREMNKTFQWPGQNWPNPKVQEVHLSGIQDLFAGEVTAQELCKKMDEAYQSGG